MKCYYEELFVERDASECEIKTAYRKLALKWHPDKNPDSIEEAKERFQLIQQAYEVLSDPQERAWYDNHREQILRGKNSDYEDNCLDVFQYFTVSCFKGFADDEKGFYAVYREVFEKIASEDIEFMDDEMEMERIPKFGDSKSSYEEVVGPFYAYWSAYCTKRTYTWLCPYDINEIKDRRILREIEKDMKKVVQKAKRKRNEEVRNLVSFIRKRDKRVQTYKKLLEERSAFNRQKQEQNRLDQIRRRQQELEEMRKNSQAASSKIDIDYEEQLKQLEQEYSTDDEYYDDEDEPQENVILKGDEDFEQTADNDIDEYVYDLYCVACNKEFKTEKAFSNHETSKKHRDNVEKLKIKMQDEESTFSHCDKIEIKGNTSISSESIEEEDYEGKGNCQLNGVISKSNKSKNKKDTKKLKQAVLLNSDENIDIGKDVKVPLKLNLSENHDTDDDWSSTKKKSSKKSRGKNKTTSKSTPFDTQDLKFENEPKTSLNIVSEPKNDLETETSQNACATCKAIFESKNKLFSHLKLTNHSVFIPKIKTVAENTKNRKTKNKKN